MCTENINLQYENFFTSFGQNTAELYDKHIILYVTMICIFWPEFGLIQRYFALLLYCITSYISSRRDIFCEGAL